MQELNGLRGAYEQQQQQAQQESGEGNSPEPGLQDQADLIAQLTEQAQQARQDLAAQRAKTMALQKVVHSLHLRGLRLPGSVVVCV